MTEETTKQLRIAQNKTGKKLRIAIVGDLAAVVDRVLNRERIGERVEPLSRKIVEREAGIVEAPDGAGLASL